MRKRKSPNTKVYVIIGGGVSAVSCAQELRRIVGVDTRVLIITATELIKEVEVKSRITNHLESLTVVEKTLDQFQELNSNIEVIRGVAVKIDSVSKHVILADGNSIVYDKLCICSGSVPKLIEQNPNIIGIRDIDSVTDMCDRLSNYSTVAVVGNGGIALEVVNELRYCNLHWIIKDDFTGSTFFDASASFFLMPSLAHRIQSNQSISQYNSENPSMRSSNINVFQHKVSGSSLGPDWVIKAGLKDKLDPNISTHHMKCLEIHYSQEVIATHNHFPVDILQQSTHKNQLPENSLLYPLYLQTSTNEIIGCDFAISATGVTSLPCLIFAGSEFSRDSEGYLLVDEYMETSVKDVYAAGDCCCYRPATNSIEENEEETPSQHWFQMKLWTQARQMGLYAAHCMCDREIGDPDMHNFFFEIFAHTTHFLDYKVVLLGRFNGQGLETFNVNKKSNASDLEKTNENSSMKSSSVEIWLRITTNKEYIKLVVHRNRIVGALLIGETELEEVVENLILNKTDVSSYGIDILNPDFEIDDYFD